MIYRALYEEGKNLLMQADIEDAAWDARLLLEHVCHTNRNDLLVHGDREVAEADQEKYLELIAERAKHIPLQHLTGVCGFMGLEFLVNEHVLIPRPDTEILVEEALKYVHDGFRILDMCTGSGCILLSLLQYSNDCMGVGADLSEKALETARKNGERLSEGGPLDGRIKPENLCFVHSDLFENIEGKFEIIVSNPPYIQSEVIEGLMDEVKDHEPRMALDGGNDGLDFYRKIIQDSRAHLCGGGMLFFEIGYDQREDVSRLMEEAGFVSVTAVKDFAGLDRVVYGTKM